MTLGTKLQRLAIQMPLLEEDSSSEEEGEEEGGGGGGGGGGDDVVQMKAALQKEIDATRAALLAVDESLAGGNIV